MSESASNTNHEFTLKCRSKGSFTGIKKVVSACDTSVSLVSNCGNITISGEKLHIVKYNENDGTLELDGNVNCIKYTGAKQPLLKRLFK